MMNVESFLEKARNIQIDWKEKFVTPVSVCAIKKDGKYYQGYGVEKVKAYDGADIVENNVITYDFGEHYTGYLSFSLNGYGEISDSPVRLKLTFAEVPFDFSSEDGKREGWLSYSWLQEEIITVDEIPSCVKMPRRYAMRYVKLEIIAKNKVMKLEVSDVCFHAVSSADFNFVPVVKNERFRKITEVSARTLRECMQGIYEDGPKRDRRLWVGDLRLQAIVNYETFKDVNLIKKCLYLFAGLVYEDGRIPACLYEKPRLLNGNIHLLDYSMFYMVALYEYFEFSGDKATAQELFDIAYLQFKFLYNLLDEEGRIIGPKSWWCFIDWNFAADDAPKSLAMAGISAYCLIYAEKLAKALGKTEEALEAAAMREHICTAAKKYYYNADVGLYEEEKTISWVANSFMILSGSLDEREGYSLMKRLVKCKEAILPVTPYAYHYILEAYAKSGMWTEMEDLIDIYWGQMIKNGADTFWEAFSMDNPYFSPYDDCILNSSCHAWSCTPIYFVNKYLD